MRCPSDCHVSYYLRSFPPNCLAGLRRDFLVIVWLFSGAWSPGLKLSNVRGMSARSLDLHSVSFCS